MLDALLSNQNIVQGGGIVVAIVLIWAIVTLVRENTKTNSAITNGCEARFAALVASSNAVIERNTQAHVENARAIAEQRVLISHIGDVLERTR